MDGGDGLARQPSGQVVGLPEADVVEREAGWLGVEGLDDVARGAAVAGEDEPHAVAPARRPSNQRWAAAKSSAAEGPITGVPGSPDARPLAARG